MPYWGPLITYMRLKTGVRLPCWLGRVGHTPNIKDIKRGCFVYPRGFLSLTGVSAHRRVDGGWTVKMTWKIHGVMMIKDEHLIGLIMQERWRRKWSQGELSRRSGVDRSDISAAESGRRPAGVKVLGRLAKALGLELTVREKK